MQFNGLPELKRHLAGVAPKPALDLKEVTDVDFEVVHFLVGCLKKGIEIRNCAPYIREWIRRDQSRQADEWEN